MANPEHLSKLKEGLDEWNQWRDNNIDVSPDLRNAELNGINLSRGTVYLSKVNFSGANLTEANLGGALLNEANFKGANLMLSKLNATSLKKARLSKASLRYADLCNSDLTMADLAGTDLIGTNLNDADFSGADLSNADLNSAKLINTNLSKANLRRTRLTRAHIEKAKTNNAIFEDAEFGYNTLVDLGLDLAIGIETIEHIGPSTVGTDTLKRSQGKLPESFLRGCGLSPWEIEIARLYNPDLSPLDIDEILATKIFQKRIEGPLYIGGVFISYSHADSDFVDKLYEKHQDAGVSVWLDKHDILAGNIEKQVMRQIRIKDIVLLVLSENSINSDWVETELEEAREKEKKEKRDVLCPIAIDASWKDKGGILWRKLKRDKVILDFSDWLTEQEFKKQFDRLIKGYQLNY